MTRDELLAARTVTWSAADRSAIAAAVDALRPSPRHLADVLDWLDDIRARDAVAPADVLAEAGVRAAFGTPGSPPDRLKRWKDALRRRRFPRLAAREREFAAAVRALDLGRSVTVLPPAGFEGNAITITLRAGSAVELDADLDRLNRARRQLLSLFDLLT